MTKARSSETKLNHTNMLKDSALVIFTNTLGPISTRQELGSAYGRGVRDLVFAEQ